MLSNKRAEFGFVRGIPLEGLSHLAPVGRAHPPALPQVLLVLHHLGQWLQPVFQVKKHHHHHSVICKSNLIFRNKVSGSFRNEKEILDIFESYGRMKAITPFDCDHGQQSAHRVSVGLCLGLYHIFSPSCFWFCFYIPDGTLR